MVLVCFLLSLILAHDTWLRYFWESQELKLQTGNQFPNGDSAVLPKRIEKSGVISPGGEVYDLNDFAVRGDETVIRLAHNESSLAFVSLYSHFIQLESSDFDSYLQHENADDILEMRAGSHLPGRELYTKHAKTLIGASGGCLQSGQIFEIVPSRDPRAHSSLEVILVKGGNPCPDKWVTAYSASGHEQKAKTDIQGKASFTLSECTEWCLRAHWIAATDESGADWQSHWATLTFFRQA